jgi:hypothetical protein
VNDAQETKAFYEVLGYLHALRHENLGVGGFTHSQVRPAVFHGYWWPEEAEEPVSDEIILCFPRTPRNSGLSYESSRK